MANSFFTVSAISKELVRLMENELVLGKAVGTDQLENETVKSGGTVKVRRQMQYLGQDNNLDLTSYSEDITEGTVTVTMDQTWSNKVSISALDRTLSFDRYSEMVLKPMARRAAERIEASIAALYPYFYLFDGTPGTVPATFAALADAGAIFTRCVATELPDLFDGSDKFAERTLKGRVLADPNTGLFGELTLSGNAAA